MLSRLTSYKNSTLIGAAMIIFGLILPAFVNVRSFRIYHLLDRAAAARDVALLIVSAFLLVFLNSIRALPIYLGSYLFCSEICQKSRWFFRATVIVIIFASYQLTSMIYSIRYDFGIPSLLVILFIYMLSGFNLETVKMYQRSTVLICALIGTQFLDVIPALTKYGFGRGIASTDIKLLAEYFDEYNILTIFSAFQMAIFIFMAVLLSQLLTDQHRLLISAQELSATRLQALEARKDSEIKHLVHDLKTPLTAIEALSGVSYMISDNEKIKEYQKRITDSAESMGKMISQILEIDHRCRMTTRELFDYSLFQITSQYCKDRINVVNNAPDKMICVNKITFSRALVNLINNADDAIDCQTGRITIEVDCQDGDIIITVSDNGCGIPKKDLAAVWEPGFSSHGSTGLGMSYVKEIIEGYGGTISISSELNRGTTISIRIKEADLNERFDDNSPGDR